MNLQTDTLSNELKKDLARNRDGRLSTRQWIELISQPLTSLMLLAVPMILLIGRFGVAGRYIVMLVVAGFGIMIVMRAIRFARVTLHYRVLHVERTHPRWKFWRKLTLVTKRGEPFVFDQHVATRLQLPDNQAVQVYYIDLFNRHILVSALPEKHPQASFANPTHQFTSRHGIRHPD